MRSYLQFSWPIAVGGLSTIVISQGTVLVGEAALGLAGVGVITLASAVIQYSDRVDQIVTQTLYPAVCAVRDRKDLLLEAFVKSNRLGLMWGMPFGIGLALLALYVLWEAATTIARPPRDESIYLLRLSCAAGVLGFLTDGFFFGAPLALGQLNVWPLLLWAQIGLLAGTRSRARA